jgi:hypothetical protein
MLRLLIVVSVAATAAFVCVEPPASSACPISVSKPVRVLYQESALVAVARVGDSVLVETGERSTLAKTALHISLLLKGESKERVVPFYHWVGAEMDVNSPYAFAKDDVLLVFLSPDDKGDGYHAADYERGVKRLSPDDLKVYVSRLEELALIMRHEKPDAAALTEWLVRCAEEPATRWEGVFELAYGVSLLSDMEEATANEEAAANSDTFVIDPKSLVDFGKRDESQAKDKDDGYSDVREAAEAVVANNSAQNESREGNTPSEVISSPNLVNPIDFTALLTPAHKERLTNTLLAAEELDWNELMLLRLVGNWKDARLVPFSLKHLARMADKPPYQAEDLMRVVAYTLADQTLIKFVADYSKNMSYEDLYNINEDESEAEEEDSEATAEERAESKKEREEMRAVAAEARFKRSGKLRHFLALADQPQKP